MPEIRKKLKDDQPEGALSKSFMDVIKGKSKLKRKLTKAEEAEDIRNRLRGTTGGGRSAAGPGMKKGGMMKKKGYAMGGALKGGQKKLDRNKDGKISGDDFKMMKKKGGGMMKKKGMAKGGKVRGSGIARQGVRAAKMV
jgi:hypothetical protein